MSPPEAQRGGPGSPAALFFAFNRLSMQGFGGVLPVAQRELVERLGWLEKSEFVALLSLGQVLPGPNIVNMALIFGDRCFGWRGAFAALAGLLAAPLALVLLLTVIVQRAGHAPWVADALRGMGVVAAGLILSTAIKVASTLRQNRLGMALCALLLALTVLTVGLLRWPLAAVMAGLGPLAWALAWWKLRP